MAVFFIVPIFLRNLYPKFDLDSYLAYFLINTTFISFRGNLSLKILLPASRLRTNVNAFSTRPSASVHSRPFETTCVRFSFTPEVEAIVRGLRAGLSAPPVVVFKDWDAVAEGSRPFRLYCDASVDGFDATLEQQQPNGSVRTVFYINRATLNNERHWTSVDLSTLEASSGA